MSNLLSAPDYEAQNSTERLAGFYPESSSRDGFFRAVYGVLIEKVRDTDAPADIARDADGYLELLDIVLESEDILRDSGNVGLDHEDERSLGMLMCQLDSIYEDEAGGKITPQVEGMFLARSAIFEAYDTGAFVERTV